MAQRMWNFENGDGTTLTSTAGAGQIVADDAAVAAQAIFGTGTGTFIARASHARLGTCSAEVAAAAGASGQMRLPFPASHDVGVVNFYHFAAAGPGTNAMIASWRTGAGPVFRVGVGGAANTKIVIQDAAPTIVGTSTGSITFNQLNRWEVVYDRTAGNVTVNVYSLDTTSSPMATLTVTGQSIGSASYVNLDVGNPTAVANAWTQYFDVVRMDTGRTTEIGPPINADPTVDAGANQTVAAGATVNLSASASDTDGTIASHAWTFDYPTSGAPSLTGGSTATPSFTAGAAGSLYVLRDTVTDSGGATASDTVEVRVPTAGTLTPLPDYPTITVGAWSNVGGAASEGAALADASDTTYLEGPTASGTEASKRVRLTPSTTRSGMTITARIAQSVSGSMTVTARLYEGTTLRETFGSVSSSTTITDRVLTVASGTLSAISDPGNLWLEMAYTT